MALSENDPCSYSRPELCRVTSIDLDLDVDFGKKVIGGTANIAVEKKDESAVSLILDTRDLTISGVTEAGSGQVLDFKLGDQSKVKEFGSKLEIKLPTNSGKNLTLSIKYCTSPCSSALQWLVPEQTAGKRQPYLFSQCQAIHARSLLPCQDTPSVKFTYNAKVQAPREITILMSAVRLGAEACEGDSGKLVHCFEQKVPIPSYLLAIVGGDLESRKIGPRSKVWSEKELIEQSAYEFAETEQQLATAESLCGPYVWGQYDLLILPPSFPYGGMENPCLTFVTPTLLAGDRSLADVVAHEIAHSWTGNLVTNSTFQDFWLNEGHTVFVERKIVSRMHGGEPLRQFLAGEGWKTLQETVKQLVSAGESPYTCLVPNLDGIDPDDAFSSVPYEKGFALLFYLERLLGGPAVYEPFLKAYIENFKYQSISTQQWKDFLFSYFTSQEDQAKLKAVDWGMWMSGEGTPAVTPQFDTSLDKPCLDLASRWVSAANDALSVFAPSDLQEFSPLQKRIFVDSLVQGEPLGITKLKAMDKAYAFSAIRNSEIRFRWLRLGLKSHWKDAIKPALEFVTEQGRMKFVRPIYRDMYAWEEARPEAIDNFVKHRAEMHSTTAKEVAKDLKLEKH